MSECSETNIVLVCSSPIKCEFLKGIKSGYYLNELNRIVTPLKNKQTNKKSDENVTGKLTLNEMNSND